MDDELFNTADEHCTPQIKRHDLRFRPPEERAPQLAPQQSSVSRPDYDDFLRRCVPCEPCIMRVVALCCRCECMA